MGEDLFWAIRGGGGGSFGIVLAWKLKLVPVPANVTACRVTRTLEQNATKLVHRWQYITHKLPRDIHTSIAISRVNSSEDVRAAFGSVFLGSIDELLPVMEEKFPQLGLVKEDCFEMSWAETNLYIERFPVGVPLETLLDRRLWGKFHEQEAKSAVMEFVAYGGKMDKIPETETPFPHGAGNLYGIMYLVKWEEEENINSEKFMDWIRRVYNYMTPFVSKSPREAYINYRDLEIGSNKISDDKGSCAQARIWGPKYFKNNFNRLVHVKTKVDPENFFRNEQSIPPLPCLLKKGAN
ncbi:hypothetical protein V6N11_011813 [Hibiscus sabdariffa]|uniref:Berberine/berberine-like domain-containing protein n=1 Tax=Hibiscus sabdariffa TaxID=183260 RepID=A0ABR2SA81_9ROSI